VDQPVVEVDKREVEKRCYIPLPMKALVHSCHASSFIMRTRKYAFTRKEEI
jgi:hypothetical protein